MGFWDSLKAAKAAIEMTITEGGFIGSTCDFNVLDYFMEKKDVDDNPSESNEDSDSKGDDDSRSPKND